VQADGEADVRGLPEVVGTLLLLSGVLDVHHIGQFLKYVENHI
jgi:uncharacterized membrane protein SirB2